MTFDLDDRPKTRPAALRWQAFAATLAAAVLLAGTAYAQLEPWTGVAFSQTEPDPHRDLIGEAEGGDRVGQSMTVGDFNHDGFVDLAIGVPDEAAGDLLYSGGVHVVYGSRGGLDARVDDWWDQSGDIAGAVEAFDRMGSALAAGDFNCDGFDDLAIGSPGESIGSVVGAGGVNVIYGSAQGLRVAGNQGWHQDVAGVAGGPEANDKFGYALAAGDFDGDGCDDLAIGVEGESIGAIGGAGAVQVLFGSTTAGLTATGDQWLDREGPGMGGAIASEHLGFALAAGNFDGDAYDDLAIGVPGDSREVSGAGSVQVVYGSVDGLDQATNTTWRMTSPSSDEGLGVSLAAGDFDGDQFDDLAAGVPSHEVGADGSAGGVLVLYGTSGGITSARRWELEQGVAGLAGPTQAGANFGRGVATGDLDGDGADDLVVGAPYRNVAGLTATGQLHVVYGSTLFGLSGVRDETWNRSQLGAATPILESDGLGWAVVVGDFNGGGTADVAASARTRRVGSVYSAGDVVTVASDASLVYDDFESGDLAGWSAIAP